LGALYQWELALVYQAAQARAESDSVTGSPQKATRGSPGDLIEVIAEIVAQRVECEQDSEYKQEVPMAAKSPFHDNSH